MKKLFLLFGLLVIGGGLFVNLPQGNYVWFVYDMLTGALCIFVAKNVL